MTRRVLGRAYAFFSSSAPKNEVEAGFRKAREFAACKPKLELSLNDSPTQEMLDDPGLMPIVVMAKVEGRNYFLEARIPGASNKVTADELACLMAALPPRQADDAGPVSCEICFKADKGGYAFRE